jgi:hypothetical protein
MRIDSEVVVTTLDGGERIPWTAYSRIHDSEMKEINRSVVKNIYSTLCLLEEFSSLPWWMPMPHNWDEAKHAPWYKMARKQLRAHISSSPELE